MVESVKIEARLNAQQRSHYQGLRHVQDFLLLFGKVLLLVVIRSLKINRILCRRSSREVCVVGNNED